MVDRDLETETLRRLLLEALKEIDRFPEPAGDVAHAVAGERELESHERAGVSPALDEPPRVPGVDGRVDGLRVQLHAARRAAPSCSRRGTRWP